MDEFDTPEQEPTQERSFFSKYSIFFCAECKNMMSPGKSNGSLLEFKCLACKSKQINFASRSEEDCMLYNKGTVAGSKRAVANVNLIFDPSMPRVKTQCPQCGLNEAVYILTPDQGQRKIVAQMICTNANVAMGFAKCRGVWILPETDYLEPYAIIKGTNVD